MQTTFDVNSYIANSDHCFFLYLLFWDRVYRLLLLDLTNLVVTSFSNVYFGLSLLRKIRIATEVHFVRT